MHNLYFEQKFEKKKNKKKKKSEFLSENFHFSVVKFSVYLNRRVFVMRYKNRRKYIEGVEEDPKHISFQWHQEKATQTKDKQTNQLPLITSITMQAGIRRKRHNKQENTAANNRKSYKE